MELRGIERLEDVLRSTPNVMIGGLGGTGQARPAFAMRGIRGAGFFVDGIFQQTTIGLGQRSVAEVDRVEVLRGPQGTLFGRDTTGGAIRIFTRLPAHEFGVRATATVGNYDRRDLILHADLPISDTLLSKFSVSSEQRDGYVKSIITGRSTGEIDDQSVRADFLWLPNDRFSVRLWGDTSRQRSTQPSYTLHIIDPGAPGIDPGFGFQVPNYQLYEILGIAFNCQSNVPECPGGRVGDLESVSNYDGGPGVMVDQDNYNLKLDFKLTENIAVSSLSNYSEFTSWFYQNYSNAPVDFFSLGEYQERESWSQEFQLTGDLARFHWVTGLYGWNTGSKGRMMRWAFADIDAAEFATIAASPFCNPRIPGLVPCGRGPLISISQLLEEEQEGWAGFGEFTFDLTRTLSVTAGGRYHDQTNNSWTLLAGPTTPPQSNIPGHLPVGDLLANAGRTLPVENTFTKDTYRLAVTNKFSEDLMIYAGFSQGHNGGGVTRINVPDANGNPILTDFPFDPELIDNYELGMRSDWLSGTLRLNLTLFHTEWQDIQLRAPARNPLTGAVLPGILLQNAASAEAEGAELEIVYRPVPQLVLDLALGILDTKYTELGAGVPELTLDSKFGVAPEQQLSVGGQWTADLSEGRELLFRLDYNYTSGFMRNPVPSEQSSTYTGAKWEQPAFGLLSARAVYIPPGGNWEAAIFGTNLTDERYSTGGFLPSLLGVDAGTIGRPREYGASLKFYFR